MKTIKLVQFLFAGISISALLSSPADAQKVQVMVQDVLIQGAQDLDLIGGAQPVNTKAGLQKQMRGLIQNELSIVGDLCDLEPNKQLLLANLAESEWTAKTNQSILKRTQENVYGMIDLDGLAERLVRNWLESIATAEQLGRYDEELADRMLWRQKAVVSKLLDTLEVKLNLSGVQMRQIEVRLKEKWKDRFYHSLEATFDNTTLLPEIRPTWIAEFLSESQRSAFVTSNAQPQKFIQAWHDSPSISLDERFKVGNVVSTEPNGTETSGKKPSPAEAVLKKAKAEDESVIDVKKP
jgi:hypothetical protein